MGMTRRKSGRKTRRKRARKTRSSGGSCIARRRGGSLRRCLACRESRLRWQQPIGGRQPPAGGKRIDNHYINIIVT